MLTVLKLSYQVWHKISEEELTKLVGLPSGITKSDYKEITGKNYAEPDKAE